MYLVDRSFDIGQTYFEAALLRDLHGSGVEIVITFPVLRGFHEVQRRFDEIRLDTANTRKEMVTDQDSTGGSWVRCPPADTKGMLVEVSQDFIAKFPHCGDIDAQSPGQAPGSWFCGIICSTKAISISRRHAR
jgi:hypothetical protein